MITSLKVTMILRLFNNWHEIKVISYVFKLQLFYFTKWKYFTNAFKIWPKFFYFFALSFKLRNREQEKVDIALLMNVKRCQLCKVNFFLSTKLKKIKNIAAGISIFFRGLASVSVSLSLQFDSYFLYICLWNCQCLSFDSFHLLQDTGKQLQRLA